MVATSKFFRATYGNNLTTLKFDSPPTIAIWAMLTYAHHNHKLLNSIGRPDCELIIANARISLLKADEFRLLWSLA